MTDAGSPAEGSHPAPSNPEVSAPQTPNALTSTPGAPTISRWGRRASRVYLVVCAIALVAMLAETLTGRGGAGTMFAAVLAAPWSMLAANFLPPFPSNWPLALGLGARLVLLGLFMLLNAAIVRGMAARSERDLSRTATRVSTLVLLAAVLSSGCILTSRQVVIVAEPRGVTQLLGGTTATSIYRFDLTTLPAWNDHRGKIVRVTDVALMGDFSNPTGPIGPGAPVDVAVAVSPAPIAFPGVPSGSEPQVWGPLHLDVDARHRVSWNEGAARIVGHAQALQGEMAGDGQFDLLVVSRLTRPGIGIASVDNFRIGAVLEVK